MQIVAVQLAVENLKLEINSKKVLKLLHENQRFSVIFHFTRPGAEKTESKQSNLVTAPHCPGLQEGASFTSGLPPYFFPPAILCSHIRSLTQFLGLTLDGSVFLILYKPIIWFSTIYCRPNEQKCDHDVGCKAIHYLLEGYTKIDPRRNCPIKTNPNA